MPHDFSCLWVCLEGVFTSCDMCTHTCRSLSLSPDPSTSLSLAGMLHNTGRLEAALQVFREGLGSSPNNTDLICGMVSSEWLQRQHAGRACMAPLHSDWSALHRRKANFDLGEGHDSVKLGALPVCAPFPLSLHTCIGHVQTGGPLCPSLHSYM